MATPESGPGVGLNIGVVGVTWLSCKVFVGELLLGQQKSGRNNKFKGVAVLTGGRMAGFHRI